MKDEIKEILDYLRNDEWEIGYGDYEKSLFKSEIKMLLDYITNLQQEIKEANDIITWWTNRFKAVERDNRELKEELEEEKRIDKAVEQAKEKIKGYKETIDMLITSSVENKRYEIAELKYRIREQEDLLNILQNGDEDNE